MLDANEQTAQVIRDNWARVQDLVQRACVTAGRDRSEVTIVGVSKYVSPALALQLVGAGCTVLGENRPQALWEKAGYFQEQGETRCSWHFIGHLQRNKIRRTLPLIDCLHSLDSVRLAESVSQDLKREGQSLRTLVEVNVTQDTTKTGLSLMQVEELLSQADRFPGIEFRGLMAMSSHHAGSERVRAEFASVRKLRDEMQQRFPSLNLSDLSMGMSGDFSEAIAEGATMIRVGSLLWDGLK